MILFEFPSSFEPDYFTVYMFIENVFPSTIDLQFIGNKLLDFRSKTLRGNKTTNAKNKMKNSTKLLFKALKSETKKRCWTRREVPRKRVKSISSNNGKKFNKFNMECA